MMPLQAKKSELTGFSSFLSILFLGTSTVHAEFNPVFCCARFAGVFVTDTLPRFDYTQPQDCEKHCIDDPTCLEAFWSNYLGGSCWVASQKVQHNDRWGQSDDFISYHCRSRSLNLNSGICPRREGVRLVGVPGHYANVAATNDMDCVSKCRNDAECVAATFESSTCWHFSAHPGIVREGGRHAWICRERMLSCQAEMAQNKTCIEAPGLRLMAAGAATQVANTLIEPQDCAQECLSDQKCLASCFVESTGVCWLYYNTPGQVFQPGFVSYLCTPPIRGRQCTRFDSLQLQASPPAAKYISVEGSEDCLDHCKEDLSCVGMTRNQASHHDCWLIFDSSAVTEVQTDWQYISYKCEGY